MFWGEILEKIEKGDNSTIKDITQELIHKIKGN